MSGSYLELDTVCACVCICVCVCVSVCVHVSLCLCLCVFNVLHTVSNYWRIYKGFYPYSQNKCLILGFEHIFVTNELILQAIPSKKSL